jgi:hypothetical protein
MARESAQFRPLVAKLGEVMRSELTSIVEVPCDIPTTLALRSDGGPVTSTSPQEHSPDKPASYLKVTGE